MFKYAENPFGACHAGEATLAQHGPFAASVFPNSAYGSTAATLATSAPPTMVRFATLAAD